MWATFQDYATTDPLQADGFGIGWYDAFPPAPIATVLPPAGNGHVTPVSAKSGVATPVRGEENDGEAKGQDEKTEEIMRLREEEQIREKQRPCVYKSLSPVSLHLMEFAWS